MTEVTGRSGVDFTYQNGAESRQDTVLESLGGGVAMFDYDGDGKLDLFFPGGGGFEPSQQPPSITGRPGDLFRNFGEWEFRSAGRAAHVREAPFYSHGCSCGDYDADGFPDMLVTGYGGLQFFRNQGDGTFQEVSSPAGLNDRLWSSGAGWGDLNGDGDLDLYVAHYLNWSFDNHPFCRTAAPNKREVCPPRMFEPLPHVVYYSNGDGTFRDATREARLIVDPKACGKGLGVLLGDVDLDGDLDIYVANDTVDNFLYVNDGSGVFSEEGLQRGCALNDEGEADGSMGVDLADYNLDGWPDLWTVNFENEAYALYRNDRDGQFQYVSQLVGMTAMGGQFVGFGTSFADFDRDGDEDLVVVNGHIINYPLTSPKRQLPVVLINDRKRERFVRASFAADNYFSIPHLGRGLAAGDLDDDGDIDLAVSHTNEPASLIECEPLPEDRAAKDRENANQWLRTRLIGRRSNRDCVGARLVLHTSAGDQVRQIKGGGSYLSQNDMRPFWGIRAGVNVLGLSIIWPSGLKQEVAPVQVDRPLTLIEPEPSAP